MQHQVVAFTEERRPHGDRRQLAQVVHCAYPGCKNEEVFFNGKGTGKLPPEMLTRRLKAHDWEISGPDACCPLHATKPIQLKVAPLQPHKPASHPDYYPKETPIVAQPTTVKSFEDIGAASSRLMTPEHKRKINRLIYGNWDEDKARYLGEMTDQKIATELGVPRDWVAQVRVELYGESGGNEEMDALKEEVEAALRKWEPIVSAAAKAVGEAVDKVSNLETLVADLRALKKRLERIEVAVLPRR